MTADAYVPKSVLEDLSRVPQDRPIGLLLRHAIREEIPRGETGDELPITQGGQSTAMSLGGVLSDRLRGLHSSPIRRCKETAEALLAGAQGKIAIAESRLLGAPGAYVKEADRAWVNWQRLGHAGVIEHLVRGGDTLDGMASPAVAAKRVVRFILEQCESLTGIHVFVTHDSILAPTASHFLRQPLEPREWPSYLEGAYFWRKGTLVQTLYRGKVHGADVEGLCNVEGKR